MACYLTQTLRLYHGSGGVASIFDLTVVFPSFDNTIEADDSVASAHRRLRVTPFLLICGSLHEQASGKIGSHDVARQRTYRVGRYLSG